MKKNVILMVFSLILWGCSKPEGEVKLFAGGGLKKAVDELCNEFEASSGIHVEPDYAGSGTIMARETDDLAVYLFMPGDVYYVTQLDELTKGGVEKQTPICYFVPVILVKKGNPKGIKTLQDLARKDVKVAFGNPKACQVGRVSRKICAKAGLDADKLSRKLSLTVNELAVWVKMDDVDATIVWDAIAANVADSCEAVEIPLDQNIISSVVIGEMKNAPMKKEARMFVDFLTSPAGQKILEKNGFRTTAPVGMKN